jgi:HK97 family phage portal protein
VPPFAVTGGFKSGGAMGRAADDLEESVRKAAKEKRVALVLPTGLEIKPIGGDPDKNQMIEAQRFMVEQVARIYSMPPIFLQDLTHGTFSNTEQQDLHFVKHTVKRWVEQIEQELNLKFFGRGSKFFVEFSMDGLLRGDFKTRMDGYAQAIQNAILTPNEVAALENRPPRPGGNDLLIQGATVPLVSAGKTQEPPQ